MINCWTNEDTAAALVATLRKIITIGCLKRGREIEE